MNLKNHPFAVKAFFERSVVFTFAVPKEALQSFLPNRLKLDTFQEKWAFLAVAMVQTKELRPKGFPSFMGTNFFLIGYRIFTRYTSLSGKNLRGLYILKSETDKQKMKILGNLFTHYNYTTTDIHQLEEGTTNTISSKKSGFNVCFDHPQEKINLPLNSPFSNWKEARRFAGPLPFTFTYSEDSDSMLIIEGLRKNWKPQPLRVHASNFSFVQNLSPHTFVLASAFEVTGIPYTWKKGKAEQWS